MKTNYQPHVRKESRKFHQKEQTTSTYFMSQTLLIIMLPKLAETRLRKETGYWVFTQQINQSCQGNTLTQRNVEKCLNT